MKAITTKWAGVTETKPARIIASDSDGNRVEKSMGALTGCSDAQALDYHRSAAEALCLKMKWEGKLISGGIRGGYVWVFADEAVEALRGALDKIRKIAYASEYDKAGDAILKIIGIAEDAIRGDAK